MYCLFLKLEVPLRNLLKYVINPALILKFTNFIFLGKSFQRYNTSIAVGTVASTVPVSCYIYVYVYFDSDGVIFLSPSNNVFLWKAETGARTVMEMEAMPLPRHRSCSYVLSFHVIPCGRDVDISYILMR